MITTVQDIVFVAKIFIKAKPVQKARPILNCTEKRDGLSEDAYVLEKLNNRDQHQLNILI